LSLFVEVKGKRGGNIVNVRIVMDSGKEYIAEGTLENAIDQCYETGEIPSPLGGRGTTYTKFAVKFIKISEKICINTSHISSIEGIE